jgi:hypothetical protein
MAELSPEAQRLLAARRAAVEELKALDGKERSITDSDVVRLSGARMLHDSLSTRMLLGDAVSPAEFGQAQSMVDAALSAVRAQQPHTIKFQWAETIAGICPKCKAQIDPYEAPEAIKRSQIVQPSESRSDASEPQTAREPLKTRPSHKPRAVEEPPLHERIVKDTRPNAAPSLADGQGSAVWFDQVKRS